MVEMVERSRKGVARVEGGGARVAGVEGRSSTGATGVDTLCDSTVGVMTTSSCSCSSTGSAATLLGGDAAVDPFLGPIAANGNRLLYSGGGLTLGPTLMAGASLGGGGLARRAR